MLLFKLPLLVEEDMLFEVWMKSEFRTGASRLLWLMGKFDPPWMKRLFICLSRFARYVYLCRPTRDLSRLI